MSSTPVQLPASVATVTVPVQQPLRTSMLRQCMKHWKSIVMFLGIVGLYYMYKTRRGLLSASCRMNSLNRFMPSNPVPGPSMSQPLATAITPPPSVQKQAPPPPPSPNVSIMTQVPPPTTIQGPSQLSSDPNFTPVQR